MVDFAKRDEVKRWLDAIEPAERRREVAIALAARAALRVTPLLGRELRRGKRTHDEILSTFILPPLRASALSWVAAKYPARGHALGTAAFAVAFDAFAHTEADDPAAHDAARATTAAFVTLEAADAIHLAVDAVFAAKGAAAFSTNNLLAVENVLAVSNILSLGKDNDVVAAAASDAALIDSSRSAAELAGTPLWPNGVPDWASDAWRTFKSDLLAADQNWDVWSNWYEARLAGDVADPPNEALEVARATIPEEIWRQGPAVVNAEIKRLIDLHTPKNTVVSVAAFGVETLTSVGEVTPSTAVPLQGAEAGASAGEVAPNPAPPPAGWMNAGDDSAVQLAARTRLQARAASETAFVTPPPFSVSQGPTAGTAPQSFGGTTPPANLPPIPATDPGPVLEVGEQGLALTAPTPLGDFDRSLQSALHERLRRLCPSLVEATRRVGNTHPGLKTIVDEYADLVARPMDAIDAASLWTVGVGLLANRDAFTGLPRAGVMTEPLEPDHLALLEQVAAIHGAFILGLQQGRELTERADQARLTPEILAAILPPSRDLLERWRDTGKIVEERTRAFFGAVRAATIEPSWRTARVGYSAYVVTRNALIGVGKLLLIANSIGGSFVVGAALTGVDPSLVEQTRLWVQFVLDYAQTILSFSEPFPELKTWLATIIDELARDRAFREK